MKKKTTHDAVEILYNKLYKNNPKRIASLRQEYQNAAIAHFIYNLRKQAGLTQKQLAEKVGMQASAICRLEDADYGSQSLPSFKKIVAAFGLRVQLGVRIDKQQKPVVPLSRRALKTMESFEVVL